MNLGSLPPLLRRVRRRHWLAVDWLVALAFAPPALLILLNEALSRAAELFAPLALVAFTASMALRRRWPLGCLGLVGAGLVAVMLVEPRAALTGLLALGYVLYAVAVNCRRRDALAALAGSVAVSLATALPDFRHSGMATASCLLFVTVFAVGYAVSRHRNQAVRALRDQADLAEAELERARRGVTEERVRIARELHDVVAHSMSVITVQAGFAGLVIDQRPAQARDALAAIEATGRQTLVEMRRLLGVLRAQDVQPGGSDLALTPAPGLADLDELRRRTDQAGVRAHVSVSGSPRRLPAASDLAAYRIVQEALTNVVRHAAAEQAQIELDYQPTELVIVVTDHGRGADAAQPGRVGHGLVGMRERAQLCGGTLDAGPTPHGGYQVTARLPVPAAEVVRTA